MEELRGLFIGSWGAGNDEAVWPGDASERKVALGTVVMFHYTIGISYQGSSGKKIYSASSLIQTPLCKQKIFFSDN